MRRKTPIVLLIAYLILFLVLSINPYSRATWWAENIPIMLIVLVLALTYKKFQFSNTAYLMMSVLIFMHTIGGHFTFERVPFDFITNLFGFSRNHYDRIAHFSVGFFAYPAAELLLRKKWISKPCIIILFGIFFIFSVASIYEIIEWIYAAMANPEAGASFLGSQGDIWDAQKDMLADGLGAIFAMILFKFKNFKVLNKMK